MEKSSETPLAVGIDDILAARERIAGQVLATPFLEARVLSKIAGARIYVKFENLQFTASFKERGALNRLLQLTPEERRRGVAAVSAGNHAQGVAFHARRLGIPALIFMPVTTPLTKVEQTRAHGAEIVLCGDNFSACSLQGLAHAEAEGLTLIHPFDDSQVIAGQGTIALEMIEAGPELDMMVVPVGGGGLISGMAVAAKARAPRVEIIGAQAESHPAMSEAFGGKEIPPLGQTIADGIAVKSPGRVTAEIVRRCVDDMIVAPEWAIEKAVALFINVEKTVAEGAGAAALAAVLAQPERFRGRAVGIVLSGGNIDARLLASVLTRELVREKRLITMRLPLPDQPGMLARVSTILAQAGANVVDVQHRRTWLALAANEATVDITFEARDAAHAQSVLDALADAGLPAETL